MPGTDALFVRAEAVTGDIWLEQVTLNTMGQEDTADIFDQHDVDADALAQAAMPVVREAIARGIAYQAV